MNSQYAYENTYSIPEIEFQAEELSKRLKYSMANFANMKFICSVKMRMAIVDKE